MKFLLTVLHVCVFVLVVFCIGFFSKDVVEQVIFTNADTKVFKVQIFGDEGFSTAFKLDYKKGYIVTASHVCEYSKNGLIDVHLDGWVRPSEILSMDKEHDVCLIDSPDNIKGFSHSFKLKKLNDVFSIGFNAYGNKNFTSGKAIENTTVIVSRFLINKLDDFDTCLDLDGFPRNTRYGAVCMTPITGFTTTFNSLPGNSGSPIINNLGQVLGIVSSSIDNKLTLGVNIDHVIKLIDNYERNVKAKAKDEKR